MGAPEQGRLVGSGEVECLIKEVFVAWEEPGIRESQLRDSAEQYVSG